MKKLLIVGPGNSIKDLSPEYIKNCQTISFSDSIKWFIENNIPPTYYTFLDPDSIMRVKDNINDEFLIKLKNKTTFIYNKFQGNSDFYKERFSTSRGPTWNNNTFGKDILPDFENYFKEVKTIPYIISNTYNISSSSHCIMHNPPLNICKFSCYILPMIPYLFPDVKLIESIGFGDYNSPRMYSNSTGGYSSYKESFNLVSNTLKECLIKHNINIKFLNKDSYYKSLE